MSFFVELFNFVYYKDNIVLWKWFPKCAPRNLYRGAVLPKNFIKHIWKPDDGGDENIRVYTNDA